MKLKRVRCERINGFSKILAPGTKIFAAPNTMKNKVLIRYSEKIPLNKMAFGRNKFVTSRTYVRRGNMISELLVSRLAAEHLLKMLWLILYTTK